MKKLILVILFAVLSLSLTACDVQEEEIVIWAWNQNVLIMEDAVARYKEINPEFMARVESFSQNDIDVKFKAAKELGIGNTIADVVLVDAMNLQVYYDLWPEIFYDFTSKVDDTKLDDFVSSTVDVATINNKLIALPYGIAPTFVFAYRPLWGVSRINEILENGWTWADYETYGLAIKQENPASEIYMTAYNLRKDDRLYRTMTSQKGEWLTGKTGIVEIGNSNSIQAMTWVKQFYQSGILGHADTGDYRSMMLNGQIAAQIQGFFLGGQLKSVGMATSGDWVLLPLPSWQEDESSASVTGGTYLYANNFSKEKKYAAEFIMWYTTSVDALVSGLEIGGIFPALKSSYNHEFFASEDPFFGNQAYLSQVASNVPLSPAIYAGKHNAYNYDRFALGQESILFSGLDITQTLNIVKQEIETNAQN